MTKINALPAIPKVNGGPDIALIVSFVALYDPDGRRAKPVELSERYAQRMLTISSRSTIHKRMVKACDLDLLYVDKRSHVLDSGERAGNGYRLGPIARDEKKRWSALGKVLHGVDGFVEPVRAVGAMLYNALGRDGRWLSFSLLGAAGGEAVTAAEVFDASHGLLRSEKLVVKHLKHFVVLGLATVGEPSSGSACRYRPVEASVLSDVAEVRGWTSRHLALNKRIDVERTGRTSIQARIALLPCCYCGASGPSTLEHMPPSHWTGDNRAGLFLPACKECNSGLGAMIRGLEASCVGRCEPRFEIESEDIWAAVFDAEDMNVLKMLEPWFVGLVRNYRDAGWTGDVEAAFLAAKGVAPLAVAVREGRLELFNSRCELRVVKVPEDFAFWLARAVTEVVPRAVPLGSDDRRFLMGPGAFM